MSTARTRAHLNLEHSLKFFAVACTDPVQDGSMMNLESLLQTQREAFGVHSYPAPGVRREHLAMLGAALKAFEPRLVEAADSDFGGRSPYETRLLELFPLHEAIRHARRNV